VGDHHVDLRDHLGLWHRLRADHGVGQLDLVGLRTLADHEAVPRMAKYVDQPLHQLDVSAAERAQRQVHQAAAGRPLGHRVRLTTHSLNADHVSRWVRSYSARKLAHPVGSALGRPEYAGGSSGLSTSSGLQDTMRT
jgi:hypothetical protein